MIDFLNPTVAAALAGIAGTAAIYWATSEPDGIRCDLSKLELQSIAVDPETPWIRRSPAEDKLQSFIEKFGNPQTLYEGFLNGVKVSGNKKCLRWRSSLKAGYDSYLTYKQVLERCTYVGNGLRHEGLKPTNQTYVGAISKNRYELVLVQLACYQHSMVIVPMYETLGVAGLEHMLRQTCMEIIICESEEKVNLILSLNPDSTSKIKTVVSLEELKSTEVINKIQSRGWSYIPFAQLEGNGRVHEYEQNLCKPNDDFVVCYTSGTTGIPKGAMIIHSGLVKMMLACFFSIENSVHGELFQLGGNECHISYLPLAHMYEQAVMHISLAYGWEIGFYSGDPKLLLEDMQLLQPTIFPCVPRLLTKIYDSIISKVSQSYIKSTLFERGLKTKEYYYKKGIITKSTIWDRIVFRKIQDLLGGRVKLMITGAAPIAAPVLRFLRLAFGSVVVEGYGQTECSACNTLALPGDQRVGEVGGPLSGAIVKVEDVPEMGYFKVNMEGEVCMKGTNFYGYLKDETKTAEALDSEGWLHSGDIGRWTQHGTLQIVDRKKNIFKLSQGEYVAPEKLENIYCLSKLVAQCFVHGESLKASLISIVIPDPDVLPSVVKLKLHLSEDLKLSELCSREDVKKLILEDMISVGRNAQLKGFEIVKDIHLVADPFSVENEMLTPTFKLRRFEVRKEFQQVINEMYKCLE